LIRPKQRLSQKWSRDGAMNPSETKIDFHQFLKGEISNKLEEIFGEKVYQESIVLVKKFSAKAA
jgi:hypothetical protein